MAEERYGDSLSDVDRTAFQLEDGRSTAELIATQVILFLPSHSIPA